MIKSVHIFVHVCLGVLFSFIFTSCSVENQVAAEIKQLDSVLIVLHTESDDLLKTDTVLLDRAIRKFEGYKSFMANNITDTLKRIEGNALLLFNKCGEDLVSLNKNRKTLIGRIQLNKNQIEKLVNDARENAITKNDFLIYFKTEKQNALQIISLAHDQSKKITIKIEDFKNTLLPVEALIKSRNNGILPENINDTANLL